MTISNEAVEVAARAIDASKAEGCGCCAYPEFTAEEDKRADELDISVRALLIAREALEAAAGIIRAEALTDAAEDFEGNVGVGEFAEQSIRDGAYWLHIQESWDHQGPYMDWLRNRAVAERGRQ